ncbi:putative BTB/POZ domain-containing protein [Acanthamoeba castellanii mimivirus]|uniref:Putative BTB/POZ domain-containing protein L275 n=5 Tax=Mimivirus TaxID=315393 RepID=YL275_MIMIV|nr:putative BTB/POZ domain-containing protein [Acanthamoeba polyphaga mimivirus]Q5UPV9.1 RecName: Full=Putative BTB/POZ domain-containing protein L275 [Acanthamoeba polyphaga mimivirus]ALR83856.1 putative BTB/POZ domain-containing protein [Niemeyer virus]AMK61839.1 BTB/POZ domain-containing protein [Samba virus]AMZ02724.1 putative BTB/POZ domain-containing protein [Mimivirus Bombay]BAV61373.1 putative BTB/POZ domain-containing protein [Acanthamoeba castellanii mimivirus]AAV50547.1 unknown [Ac
MSKSSTCPITIKSINGRFQTTFGTIKQFNKMVELIDTNNTINLDMDSDRIEKILNYLRGYNCSLKLIAYDANKLGLDISYDGYVYINVGGRVYYVDKDFIKSKLEFFKIFFKYNNHCHPDYSGIVIDRDYRVFEKVLRHIKGKQNDNHNLSTELDYYGLNKPIHIIEPSYFNHYSMKKNMYVKIPSTIDDKNFYCKDDIETMIYLSYKYISLIVIFFEKEIPEDISGLQFYRFVGHGFGEYDKKSCGLKSISKSQNMILIHSIPYSTEHIKNNKNTKESYYHRPLELHVNKNLNIREVVFLEKMSIDKQPDNVTCIKDYFLFKKNFGSEGGLTDFVSFNLSEFLFVDYPQCAIKKMYLKSNSKISHVEIKCNNNLVLNSPVNYIGTKDIYRITFLTVSKSRLNLLIDNRTDLNFTVYFHRKCVDQLIFGYKILRL